MRISGLGSVLLILLLPFAQPTALARSASPAATCRGCQVYMSLIAYHPQILLLAPSSGAAISSLAPILLWRAPVAGIYRIRAYDSNNVLVRNIPADVDGATTSVGVPSLVPGMTYHWKVKALNGYGWGPYLADHYFKVT